MKLAWRDRWGGPEVMRLREVETPVPTGDQVLVRVHAASVNRADLDWMLPKGGWFARVFLGLRRPHRHTLGSDVAGTVEALGPDANRFEPGDRVFGDLIRQGMAAFAEHACAPERAFQLVPDELTFEEAATLPHSALLAIMGLKPYWGQALRAGDSVMVVGASGNVGPFVVQIAKARGLHVTGVCRTQKMEFVRSLGADDVIDYTTTDYTKSGPYDRIIDVDAHRSIFGYRKALRPGGVYISMGGNGVWILSFFAAALTFGLTRGGVHMGLMPGWRPFHPDDVAILRELVAEGAIKPRIDRRYPLAEIAAALRNVHEGRNMGKIVVTMQDVENATWKSEPAWRETMVDATPQLAPRHLDQLRRSVGEVITPHDATYDDARRLWNAIHDRRPAVIVRPTSAPMVAAAVQFARDHDLEIVVRSGGHSAAGFKGDDGSLLIDLSGMRGVEVDPAMRIARSNGGALLGELDVAAQAHGLVCPTGVVGHTGVAGLTLGGGVGRLQRHFGLTIDNLAAVELVTADGRHVRATETEEPELFWGLRGAGWNFGIATAFEFRLHPFGPDLHRGVLTFPASQIHDLWDIFRAYARQAPDVVSCIFGLDRAAPDAGYTDDMVGRPIVFFAWNHSGAAEDVERDTAGLRTGPAPLTTTIGSVPYLDVQTAHDLALGWGSRSFIKSHNADGVRPEALDALVALISEPGEGTFSITALGGAIGRVPEDATAYAGRAAAFDLSADASWADQADDAANIDWCRRAMAIVEPDRVLGAYANGNSDAGQEESHRIYGDAKLARLAALKCVWDPDNVFHVNPNVAPAR